MKTVVLLIVILSILLNKQMVNNKSKIYVTNDEKVIFIKLLMIMIEVIEVIINTILIIINLLLQPTVKDHVLHIC